MIRYHSTHERLRRDVEAHRFGWLERARARTKGFEKKRKYRERSAIWGEIKDVYVSLQHAKCAFCERKLEDDPPGRIQHDMDHFRPKSSVRHWTPPQDLADLGVVSTPPAQGHHDPGYYLLAYHLFNYATSCKTCNSYLKKNYFPIAGVRRSGGRNPARLTSEKPFLIYPLGDVDDDPEGLIQFYGVSPQAKAKSGHDRSRALVTIELFQLDCGKRMKTLFRERAEVLVSLYAFLQQKDAAKSVAERRLYKSLIDAWTKPFSRHTSCAKCFLDLYERDRAEATGLAERAAAFLESVS